MLDYRLDSLLDLIELDRLLVQILKDVLLGVVLMDMHLD